MGNIQEVKAQVAELLADESFELLGMIDLESREAVQDWLHGWAAEFRAAKTYRSRS